MSKYSRIVLSMLGVNFVGAFVIFFYFAYIDLETLYANKAFWRGTEQDWTTFATVMILLGFIGAMAVWHYGRKLKFWETHLQNGERIHDLPDSLRRLAGGYPLKVALISLSIWIIVGVFFAQGGLMVGSAAGGTFWRTLIGIVIVGGVTASTLTYLVVDSMWQPTIPTFFPHGDLHQSRIVRISVGQRLVTALLMTGVVPLVVLGAAGRNSIFNMMQFDLNPYDVLAGLQQTIIFIVLVGLVSNFLLGALTTRSLLKPLKNLTQAMEQVSAGNLNIRLPVTANDELGDMTHNFNQMIAALQQSQQMRDLFGRYVSKEVADQVLKNGADLGGEQVSATALFADIRDFTGLSERLPAEAVVDVLNRYYTRMVDIIVEEGGIVNKFGGDSLLAIFGVPIRQPDHALRAVRAAWRMNRALAAFNAEQASLGLPPLTIGIGISSGDMVAGNIGGSERLEYTVIGDPVNLASRLESLTKEWGMPILLSEFTQKLLDQDTKGIEPCERVEIRGKAEPTMVYAVQNLAGSAETIA